MRRFQIPLTPGFAITAHKAQGLTMSHAIVDFVNCRGTEAAYVMASRCTSLEGLLIARPFDISKISCHRSQEARNEFNRLDLARWQTIAIHGTPQEQAFARKYLANQKDNSLTCLEQFISDRSFADQEGVAHLVAQIQGDKDWDIQGTVWRFIFTDTLNVREFSKNPQAAENG